MSRRLTHNPICIRYPSEAAVGRLTVTPLYFSLSNAADFFPKSVNIKITTGKDRSPQVMREIVNFQVFYSSINSFYVCNLPLGPVRGSPVVQLLRSAQMHAAAADISETQLSAQTATFPPSQVRETGFALTMNSSAPVIDSQSKKNHSIGEDISCIDP